MPEIRHRAGIYAPMADVYEAVSTPAGVAKWWTRDTKEAGDDRFEVWFGGAAAAAVFQLEELRPDARVVWRVLDGPAEWLDSTITFDLRREGDESIVVFTHAGWREPVEFMHHCSTRWGYFIYSLKHALETGRGNPWPDDEKVDSWG
jgi:uncharacterized protein YndB with AHSA1/START domain